MAVPRNRAVGGQADKPAGGGQKPAPKTVTVSILVDSSAVGGPVSGSGTFTFEEGATVYDALCALGLSIGSQDSIHGVYVSSINGLAEKEHGASSGWMYAVNGKLPNMACSAYKLRRWRFHPVALCDRIVDSRVGSMRASAFVRVLRWHEEARKTCGLPGFGALRERAAV